MRFDKTTNAFFEELEKISGDLMTPAVAAESNTTEGPPASPFMRRKGYKKLEHTSSLAKEADFKRIRSITAKGIGAIKGGVGKGVAQANKGITHLYNRPDVIGRATRAVTHDMADNPGSYGSLGSINLHSLTSKLFKGGSANMNDR